MKLLQLLAGQYQFILKTFGEQALSGVKAHLEKELQEVKANPSDVMEWADCFLLSIGGAMRAGEGAEQVNEYLRDVCSQPKAHPHAIQIDDLLEEVVEMDASRWQDWATMAFRVAIASTQHGHENVMLAAAEKLAINKARHWPDWKAQPLDGAIEHVKSPDEQASQDLALIGLLSLSERDKKAGKTCSVEEAIRRMGAAREAV